MAVSNAFLAWLITIFSFVNASIDVKCDAYSECANVHIKDDIGFLKGNGFDAMPNATFNHVEHKASCNAEFACANSMVTLMTKMEAYGAYSVENSTIICAEGKWCDLVFKGHYAGRGAEAICSNGATCNFLCSGSACFGLSFWCQEDSVCNFDGLPALECEFNGLSGEVQFGRVINPSDPWPTDLSHILAQSADASDSAVGNQPGLCLDNQQCSQDEILTEQKVYCAGHESCKRAKITAPVVYCGGEESCLFAEIFAPAVYCSGYRSCTGANIIQDGTAVVFVLAEHGTIKMTCLEYATCSVHCTPGLDRDCDNYIEGSGPGTIVIANAPTPEPDDDTDGGSEVELLTDEPEDFSYDIASTMINDNARSVEKQQDAGHDVVESGEEVTTDAAAVDWYLVAVVVAVVFVVVLVIGVALYYALRTKDGKEDEKEEVAKEVPDCSVEMTTDAPITM